jgi:sugar/nucleoside kinase (ribokinase family)
MARIVVVGSLNMDIVAVAPRIPHAGETILGSQYLQEPGGKGANQAYAAAKLDGDVAMLGRVGTDGHGRRLRQNLEGVGCDVSGIRASEGMSGVAVTEAAQLLNRPPSILTDPEAEGVAKQIRLLGVRTVILKLGARGCLLADGKEMCWVPSPAVRAVDTTAAGDAFNGALAVAASEGAPDVAACKFGVEAAAFSVTRLGAQRSMPGRSELASYALYQQNARRMGPADAGGR